MRKGLTILMVSIALAGCQVVGPGVDSTSRRIEVIERDTESGAQPDTSRPSERVARKVPFPEKEYEALEKSGSAAITGRLVYTTSNGETIYGSGEIVSIAPVTTYSAEAAEAALAGKAVEAADPRAQQYTRQARTDNEGYFSANNLPAGDYYVAGSVTLPDGNGRSPIILHQVSVTAGETARVTLSR